MLTLNEIRIPHFFQVAVSTLLLFSKSNPSKVHTEADGFLRCWLYK